MKRRMAIGTLCLSMSLCAAFGFSACAEEADQDAYLGEIQGSFVELFPGVLKGREPQHLGKVCGRVCRCGCGIGFR